MYDLLEDEVIVGELRKQILQKPSQQRIARLPSYYEEQVEHLKLLKEGKEKEKKPYISDFVPVKQWKILPEPEDYSIWFNGKPKMIWAWPIIYLIRLILIIGKNGRNKKGRK